MSDNDLLRRETIASILKGRVELDALRCEAQEIIARSHHSIYESLDLIAQINAILALR
jgi:hypothetical protein